MNEHPQMTALATTFFARFARFEYALKQFPEFRTGDDNRVDPSWDKFSRAPEIVSLFKVLSTDDTVLYLIDDPPMKRVIRDGALSWKICDKPKNMTELLVMHIGKASIWLNCHNY